MPVVRDPVRWGRQVIDSLVILRLAELSDLASQECRAMLSSWRRDVHTTSAKFDDTRFERLQEIIEQRLSRLLAKRSRRMIFNAVRSLSQSELRHFAGNHDMDTLTLGQIVIEATRAICWYAQPASRERQPDQPIRLSRRERSQRHELPAVIARTIVPAALLVQADVAYRWAGKGMSLLLDPAGRPLPADDSGLGWSWQPDAALGAAMAEYDTRRQNYWSTPTGMPVRGLRSFEPGAVPWLAAGLYAVPVRVRYPMLDREHITEGFMTQPLNIAERLSHLDGVDDDLRLRFGLGADSLRRVCQALAGSVIQMMGLGRLDFGPVDNGVQIITSDLTERSKAPDFLHEALGEGVLRAAPSIWVETLSRSYYGAEPPSPDEATAFIKAFTSRRGTVRRDLQPAIFHEIEKDMLVFDLAAAVEFVDLCYLSVVAGQEGQKENARGKQFEVVARQDLQERLALQPPFPVPPGYKLAKAGLADNEVDFCFWWNGVLVHMDMKSKTRGLEIFRGSFSPTRNRVSGWEAYLVNQVEPRGRALAGLLRDRGESVNAVVNFVCTADVEYIPPGPRLRYGDVPRVLTTAEIADLLKDEQRWAGVVMAARSARPSR
jgi:hypothetical protein